MGSTAALIHNLSTTWSSAVNFMPLYSQDRTLYQLNRRLGGPQQAGCFGREKPLAAGRNSNPGYPATD